MKFLIVLLFIVNVSHGQTKSTPEQVAIDYFFDHFFGINFPESEVVEFNNQTKADGYY